MTDDTTSKVDEEGNYALVESIDTVDALFFKGKANEVNFGLTLKGSKLNFYQRRNDQWTITDSLHFFNPPVLINRMDLNGDGYKDIRIASVLDKESGNLLTRVFLYDFRTKSFSHNYSFDQDNVEYDKANNFVRSWFYGIKGQASLKWKSSVSNNRLVIVSSVAYFINSKNSNLAKIEFYKYGNDASNPPAKVFDGDADSLWTVFSNTFWDSNDKIKKKKTDYE
ncbi:MAG: XAC2610-related protein [Ginsengibacter sp.]